MTDKVVSLSSGLILGMVCALFLGIGSTQNIMPSSNFELPNNFSMTIAQYPHSAEQQTQEQETIPSSSVAPPVETAESETGRITRIATLTITEDPILSTEESSPKIVHTPPVHNNSLYRTNQQRAFIANNSSAESTYSEIDIVTAKQSNFVSIANNSTGRTSGLSNSPQLDDKPQTSGSPALAHSDPGIVNNEDEQPTSLSGQENKPQPEFSLNSELINGPGDSYNPDGGRSNHDSDSRSGYCPQHPQHLNGQQRR